MFAVRSPILRNTNRGTETKARQLAGELVEVAHMQGAMGEAGCDRLRHIGVLGDQGLAVQRGRHGVEHQPELIEHPIMARAVHHIEPAVR